MKPDIIFQLIKSLSEKEKKIFIKEKLLDKNPSLQSLFHIIDKLYEYNKLEIQNQLKKLKINENSYSYLKSQLHTEILDFLIETYRNNSAYEEINKLILQAKIMHQRQLFEPAIELLKEAEMMAKKYESHLQLFNIYDLKNSIYLNIAQTHLQEITHKLFEDKNKELQKYLSFSELQQIHSEQFFKYYHNRLHANESEKKELITIQEKLNHIVIDTFIINDYKTRIRNLITYRLAEVPNNCMDNERITLWDKHEHIKIEHKESYLKLLLVHFNKSCKARQFEEASRIIPKIEGAKKELSFIDKKEEANYYNCKLTTLVFRNDLKAAEKLIQENTDLLNSVDNNIYNADINKACQYALAHAYYCLKDYKKALQYCNTILNKPKDERAFHILIAIRLLKITILYENNDLVQLYDFSRAVYMYLKRLPNTYEFEFKWLLYINSLSKCDDNKERALVLIKMKTTLATNQKVKVYEDSGIFHYTAWMDSQLQKKNYAQVLEEIAWEQYPSIFEMKF